ncbi:MAG: nickel pincer cofactor biosynthesis protein LarC [Candidatus Hodarchaeales archaeon]|jgi:uncharacterized protein (TIGR00299 family) protein
MTQLVIDPSLSGASGDMLIASLLDICPEKDRTDFCNLFTSQFQKFDPNFNVSYDTVNIEGFVGIQLKISVKKHFKPKELENFLKIVSKSLFKTEYSRIRAIKALSYLITAESKIHNFRENEGKLHFHELATIDTIFDITGFFYLLENLYGGSVKTFILPIAVGGSSKQISHGFVSIPAPVTAEIVRLGNLFIKGGPTIGELLTPTGAAILASLEAIPIEFIPKMTITNIGRSFGTVKPTKGKQTFLRILKGEGSTHLNVEDIVVLETTVDDVNGETIGYLFEILFERKLVLDFIVIPIMMKKNRPGFLLQAIVDPSKSQEVTHLLIEELGTLGIRVYPTYRHFISRDISEHTILRNSHKDSIKQKQGFLGNDVITEKIEYEDIKKIAKRENKPLRVVRKEIEAELNQGKNEDE